MPLISWEDYSAFPSESSNKVLIQEDESLGAILEQYPIEQVALISTPGPQLPLRAIFDQQCTIRFVQQDGIDLLRRQILSKCDDEFACLFCDQLEPREYCKRFNGKQQASHQVCQAFRLRNKPYQQCRNFQKGKGIQFMQNDSTNGITNRFIKKSIDVVTRSRSPVETIDQAINLVDKFSRLPIAPIKIDDDSMDLVISNLMLSRFELEPYNYFVHLMHQRFGYARLEALQEVIDPLLQKLQDKLYYAQSTRHINEIFRISNKDVGQVYFSFGPVMGQYHHAHLPMQHLDSPEVMTEHFTRVLKSA